jgi:uncharacterized membrane protein YqgA involved in biofilm formation
MPTSRHRKKHKHQQHPNPVHTKRRGSAASIMAIVGAIVGLAVTYLASNANLIWVVIITILGAIIGFLIGKTLDKAAQKGK